MNPINPYESPFPINLTCPGNYNLRDFGRHIHVFINEPFKWVLNMKGSKRATLFQKTERYYFEGAKMCHTLQYTAPT